MFFLNSCDYFTLNGTVWVRTWLAQFIILTLQQVVAAKWNPFTYPELFVFTFFISCRKSCTVMIYLHRYTPYFPIKLGVFKKKYLGMISHTCQKKTQQLVKGYTHSDTRYMKHEAKRITQIVTEHCYYECKQDSVFYITNTQTLTQLHDNCMSTTALIEHNG